MYTQTHTRAFHRSVRYMAGERDVEKRFCWVEGSSISRAEEGWMDALLRSLLIRLCGELTHKHK